jgi:hypothetical protein
LFTERLPASMGDAAPRIEEIEGRPHWLIDGELIHITGSNGAVGRPVTELMQPALRFDEMRPGVLNVRDRLRDMDLNGMWASLCFPALPFGFAGKRFLMMRDRDVALACVRAYNDWVIEEWCAAAPERLIPC